MHRLPVKLVCPRCRTPKEGGGLRIIYLEVSDDGKWHNCRSCRNKYPIFDGICCVPPDVESFHKAQAAYLDPDWPATDFEQAKRQCSSLQSLHPASKEFREALLPSTYALANFPDAVEETLLTKDLLCNIEQNENLVRCLKDHLSSSRRSPLVLDAGCGTGRFLQTPISILPVEIIGLDYRLSMLRISRRLTNTTDVLLPFCLEGKRIKPVRISHERTPTRGKSRLHLVQGDILDPPFEAEAFDALVALSLIDAVSDPIFALGQLDALLAPGGLLLIATPYHWDAQVTSVDAWWSDDDGSGADVLRATLAGRNQCLPHLSYEILHEFDAMPWVLPGHARLYHRYYLDVLLARKN